MRLRFDFDPGSGVCLWAADDEARERFGYAVELGQLELSPETVSIGQRLIAAFDESIDWNDPAARSPWSGEQRGAFHRESAEYHGRLVTELGPAYEVSFDREP